jgi:hypothetical protein
MSISTMLTLRSLTLTLTTTIECVRRLTTVGTVERSADARFRSLLFDPLAAQLAALDS